ncbi:MAG TPA: NYN domain-containing protein [Ktedonobacteraceae bacterium]|nr:NYN domain-containing protein [Ktedonobacteraceae bacterium]
MARRKKSKITATMPVIQQNILATSPVALLIDGENVIAPEMIAHILAEAGKMGGVVIRYVYGNWAAPSMRPWKDMMAYYALEQGGNVPANAGRNATDIALVIGAMDLLYRGVRHFCLVAGDSDYLPLVSRLRQDGCTVLGIGMPNASLTLKEACNRFLTIEQLTPHPASPKSAILSPTPSLTTPPEEEFSTLLTDAYCYVAKKSGNEWILLSILGKALRDRYPDFQAAHGKKKLSTMIEQHSSIFEMRPREAGKGQTTEVRLLRKKC